MYDEEYDAVLGANNFDDFGYFGENLSKNKKEEKKAEKLFDYKLLTADASIIAKR